MADLKFNSQTNLASFGQYGLRVLTGNATAGETFVAIQALEDSVISSDISLLDGEGGDTTITSLTIPAGVTIFGRFVNLEVASGKVIAYKG